MGNIAEEYFEDIEECEKCGNTKKFKAVVTTSTIFFKEDEECWEDEVNYDPMEDVEVFCGVCGEKLYGVGEE
jgi:hypothetical protein